MTLDNQINVNVSLDSPPITAVGFTTGVIAGAPTFTERIRFYPDAEASDADTTLTASLMAALQTGFSQDPTPERIGVARVGADAVQIETVLVAAADNGTYAVVLNGTSFPFVAVGSTVTLIRDGLVAAINLGSEPVTAAPISTNAMTLTADVAGDFFTAVLTQAAGFSSNLLFRATLTIDTATDDLDYSVLLDGEEYLVDSGTASSVTSVALALATAINASARFSATPLVGVITITDELSFKAFEGQQATLMTLTEMVPNQNIATELALVQAENSDWYGITPESHTATDILRVAAWAEANEKLHVPQSSDSDIKTSSTADIASQLMALSYERTALMYYSNNATDAAFAWMVNRLAVNPDEGTTIWTYVTLAGVSIDAQSTTQEGNILAKNANLYSTFFGQGATGLGTLANGLKIDLRTTGDWVKARLEERYAGILLTATNAGTKIPFTDDGIAFFKNETDSQLREGDRLGHFVQPADGAERTTVPLAADVPVAQKQVRRLTFTFKAEPAGAIEGVTVNGFVSLTI